MNILSSSLFIEVPHACAWNNAILPITIISKLVPQTSHFFFGWEPYHHSPLLSQGNLRVPQENEKMVIHHEVPCFGHPKVPKAGTLVASKGVAYLPSVP